VSGRLGHGIPGLIADSHGGQRYFNRFFKTSLHFFEANIFFFFRIPGQPYGIDVIIERICA
jgi:hypothetical protein